MKLTEKEMRMLRSSNVATMSTGEYEIGFKDRSICEKLKLEGLIKMYENHGHLGIEITKRGLYFLLKEKFDGTLSKVTFNLPEEDVNKLKSYTYEIYGRFVSEKGEKLVMVRAGVESITELKEAVPSSFDIKLKGVVKEVVNAETRDGKANKRSQ